MEQPTLDGILGMFTGATTDPAPAPAADPAPANPAPATPPEGTPPADPATPPAPAVEKPEDIFNPSKANQSFAKMRVENTSLRRVVNRFAETLGVPVTNTSNPDEIVKALTDKLIAFEAESKKIPVDLLQKVEAGEEYRQQQEAEKLHAVATKGFQTVKDKFKLTDVELREFATNLLNQGKNPYLEPIDLVDTYKLMNFDKLIEKERAAALAAEVERQKKVDTHATAPGTVTSPGGGATKPSNGRTLDEVLRDFK